MRRWLPCIRVAVLTMLSISTLRSLPSFVGAFGFGSTAMPRSFMLSVTSSAKRRSTVSQSAPASAHHADGNKRRLSACASATRVSLPEVVLVENEKRGLAKVDVEVEQFESELDKMAVVTSASASSDSDSEIDSDVEDPAPSRARLSLLESHVRILEEDCKVHELVLNAAKARAGNLYLGLDISTHSTGYTVLTPARISSTTVDEMSTEEDLLRRVLGANLVEWGCIAGSGNGCRKKKDVVDVGVIIEERLREVARRCCEREYGAARNRADFETDEPVTVDNAGRRAPVWVVGVEDFMRRFLPGKSSARSIFALAQLNGIVKYACQKHLGAKAEAFHPSRARSFYGLLSNKPEGKEMKEIVHDFALANEPGGLESRQDWPISEDGSEADEEDVDTSGNYDITDSYLVARYSWHQHVFKQVATDKQAKARFVESFEALHADKLKIAEAKALALFMAGDMPADRGKKRRKAMTEREARNAHRKLEALRLTKAYETALLHWFRQRVVPSR